jgi:hypothetical protein
MAVGAARFLLGGALGKQRERDDEPGDTVASHGIPRHAPPLRALHARKCLSRQADPLSIMLLASGAVLESGSVNAGSGSCLAVAPACKQCPNAFA